MRAATRIGIVVVCVLLAGSAAGAEDAVPAADFIKHLAGTWKAPEQRTPRTSALDEQVFGRGATDVRTVTVLVSESGEATLTIRQSVVGARGKVFVPSMTEVKMRVGGPVVSRLGHLEPTVSVTSAEKRYLDGDHERFERNPSRVTLTVVDLASRDLNLQFDPPDGDGGFGATLTRVGK